MNILYEDQHILVCEKIAGVPVQTARFGQMDMEHEILNYLAKKQPGKMPYLAVIHRLDQPVPGILVFAKTPMAAKELNRQNIQHLMTKKYLAKVDGIIPKEEDTLIDYLKKDGKTNTSSVVTKETPGAKMAKLSYKKIKEDTVEVSLFTGRHHQIRVQLSHAGMPLKGDNKYNSQVVAGEPMGLCAYYLSFVHPKTKEKMEFSMKVEM